MTSFISRAIVLAHYFLFSRFYFLYLLALYMRRLFIGPFPSGEFILTADQAHYLRDVLRMAAGDELEVFDGQGLAAVASLVSVDATGVKILIGPAHQSAGQARKVIVASATPKGNRADWMVEKLAELGVAQFIPLKTERTIVLPEGQGKSSRWQRISQEASRQSGRSDVMEIGTLMTLAACVEQINAAGATGWILSTQADAVPAMDAMGNANAGISHRDTEARRREIAKAVKNGTDPMMQGAEIGPVPLDQNLPVMDGIAGSEIKGRAPTKLCVSVSLCEISESERKGTRPFISDMYLLIGPEGGWTDRELSLATAGGVLPVRLTRTILRIETAAVAAATVACAGE